MEKLKPSTVVIGISSPSGGGKTTITKRVSELLPSSVTLFFDDYDSDTIHPESFQKWLSEGANFNDWKAPKLTDDLKRLKAGEAITSPVDGSRVSPQKYVVFDYPFGYAHGEIGKLVDFMIFIDAPLDVAMARRLLRDFTSASDSSANVADSLKEDMTSYLDYGRQAYLEMEKQVKPKCDLIIDGCLSVDDIAKEVVEKIKNKIHQRQ